MEESTTEKFSNTLISQVKITDVLMGTLRRWPWIILSVLVCVGAAWLYLQFTPPVYTRTAQVLIKSDLSDTSTEMDVFAGMGLVPPTSNINDELNKLQSPDVMREVVQQLRINLTYEDEGSWYPNLLYGTSQPITAEFPTLLDEESAAVTVTLDEKGGYTLSELSLNGKKLDSPTASFHFGDTIRTSAGTLIINATPYLTPGKTTDIHIRRMPMRDAVAKYSAELLVSRNGSQDNIVSLTVNDRSAQRAEDIINTLINVYADRWVANRNKMSAATSKFINERLTVIEQELGSVDTDLSDFQARHLIPDVQQAASFYINETRETDSRLTEMASHLQMARHLKAYIADPANKYGIIPGGTGIDNAPLNDLISQYNEMAIQHDQYTSSASKTHPVVADLEARMAAMHAAISTTLDAHINNVDDAIRNLHISQNSTNAQLAASPAQTKYLLSVERQQKVKESLYLFLLQKREENELSQAFTAYNTEVITLPEGPKGPTAPAKLKILLGALLAGLIIPFGVTYLIELSNNRVRGRKDLEALSMPMLGEIPDCSKKGVKSAPTRIVVKHNKRDIVNEAFRVLRTNLGFMTNSDSGCSVIGVTSFNPGSGKTFITMNLAVSLAIKGKRVLVVDGDLRRCTSSAYVDSPSSGLSNYLVNTVADPKSIIVADTITPGLSVLPVGTIPPNPTELLENERFGQLINELRSDYDYILIDCPPVEIMADAQIINTTVDRTIFVIRAGLFVRTMLPELERIYEKRKYRNMCMILNATPAGGEGYGYGYGYGYGNYSHYTTE